MLHRGLECWETAVDLSQNVSPPVCHARPRKAKSCSFPYSVLTAGCYPFSSSALQSFSLPEQKSLNCWLINPRVLLRTSLPYRKCRPLLRSPSTQWAYERRRPVEMALLGGRYAVWAALSAKAWGLFLRTSRPLWVDMSRLKVSLLSWASKLSSFPQRNYGTEYSTVGPGHPHTTPG